MSEINPMPPSAAATSGRIVFPHRIQRVQQHNSGASNSAASPQQQSCSTFLRGDVAQPDLSTIGGNATALARHALAMSTTNANSGSGGLHPSANNDASSGVNNAFSSTFNRSVRKGGEGGVVVGGDDTAASDNSNKPRLTSAVGVLRARVAEAARAGGGPLAPSSKLINPRVAEQYDPSTRWFNERTYHPTNVMLSPLLQETQLKELKEQLFAPPKRKKSVAVPEPSRGSSPTVDGKTSESAFLTATNIDGQPAANAATAASTGGKKKKNTPTNVTSHLNNSIGLRRMPNSDIALNDIYQAHSVSLKPPDAPFYGGALTTEGKKAKSSAGSAANPTMLTTDNVGAAMASSTTKKKKGPVAPLISNIAAIHRGLAPHVNNDNGTILLSDIQHYLASLVPPEHAQDAVTAYIRPFLRKCVDDLAQLQATAGGSAVAGNAGAEAEDLLNQTTTSGTTESVADMNNDAASTVRSVRATSRATVRVPSVAETNASRAASPSTTTIAAAYRNHTASPSVLSLGGGGGAGIRSNFGGVSNVANAALLLQQQKELREKQEEEFFTTMRLPYSHFVSCIEALLKPAEPVSNMVPDAVSGAVLSARICFALCDREKRGYITRDSIAAMKSDQNTDVDYNFNVVQGLTRAMGIVAKLEEERFAVLAKKARKGKNSKKPVPMPAVRQFHISLDEFTHVLSSDAYLPLAFLPYIIKTLMNGERDEFASDRVVFFGKSQVAYPALQRANYREKKAGEMSRETPIVLDAMSAEEIETVFKRREYPAVIHRTLSERQREEEILLTSQQQQQANGEAAAVVGAGAAENRKASASSARPSIVVAVSTPRA